MESAVIDVLIALPQEQLIAFVVPRRHALDALAHRCDVVDRVLNEQRPFVVLDETRLLAAELLNKPFAVFYLRDVGWQLQHAAQTFEPAR